MIPIPHLNDRSKQEFGSLRAESKRMPVTPEWEETISEIAANPGVAMVIGGVDTGKTRFCVELVNAGLNAGLPTAVVDADVGQSEVGAPGTIGMGLVERPIEALSDVKPKRLYFVGATTPAGHLLECAVGSKKMVDAAREHGARLIVLDTTGMVDGPLGRRLKTYKADLVRPDYLVGVQKRREVEHLLVPYQKVTPVRVRKVSSSELARRKPPEFRTARRQLNFYNHFHEAPGHIIHLDSVCTWSTSFSTGRIMKWQYVKLIENTLKCPILHAEITGNGIFAVSERQCTGRDMALLEEQFKTKSIRIVAASAFANLLLGLADENANTIDVGLLQAIDFKQRFVFVLSPIRTISPVKVLQFGSMRVTRDGKELGTIRPGEL
jgi:polynucleotide 5'-hydroxyl-kinase GRC3/NOL9